MRILVVEDEAKMAGLIQRGLAGEGMAVDVVGGGEDALWRAEATEYDAIVLDVMLPGIDGFEVCRRLRAAGVWAPVLMLTARDCGPRPGRRARPRRRRLPDEAVLVRRAARAPAGADAPWPPPSARPSSRPATCDSTRPARRAWRGETRDRALGEGVRVARDVHARTRARSCRGSSSSSTPGTTSTRTARTSSTSYVRSCGARSTSRSASSRSRRCAAAGYRLARGRRADEPAPDPAAGHARRSPP